MPLRSAGFLLSCCCSLTTCLRAGGCAGSNYPFLTRKERDSETGLDYFLARYYTSVQGRFTSTDEFKGDPAELFVLGSGDPEKQALVYASITNPQSLNKYQYTFNNPLRYVDPDGKSPQERLEIQLRNEEKAFGQGKLSREEIIARAKARGAGAIAGLLILASARSPIVAVALWRWAMRNPDKVQQAGQALTEVAGGPPTLTQLPGSRLRAAEVDSGIRLAKQIGTNLIESAHTGEEFIIAGTKVTIDVMGQSNAYKFWNATDFFDSITRHLNKSADLIAIDLKGASKEQIEAIKKFVSGLSAEQQARIIYVDP